MDKYLVDCLVLGGGVAGLASAKFLSQEFNKIFLIEKNNFLGMETSSRNSEVIHAGIYYKKKVLKSILCKKGNQTRYKYACERRINHNKCGKLIIAQNESEDKQLLKLKKNAAQNGLTL